MARKENTKAKEKKRERKLMELKMNFGSVCASAWWLSKITEPALRWSKVKAAEMQENPLAALPSFTVFNKNGVNLTLETKKYGNNLSILKNYSSKRMFHLFIFQACHAEFLRQGMAFQVTWEEHEVHVSTGVYLKSPRVINSMFFSQSNWGWNSDNKKTEVEEAAAWWVTLLI